MSDETFSEEVKRRRADLNLSMSRLGELSGVNRTHLYRIAAGKNVPSEDTKKHIRDAFDKVKEDPCLALRPSPEVAPVFNDPTDFASWVSMTGHAMGLPTSAALARALGVEQSTVSRWKKDAKPGVEHLAKISELFGVDILSLLVIAGYLPNRRPEAVDLRPRLMDGQVAVSADDVLTVLHGPISDPEAFMAAAKRLHLACLVDAEIVEEEDQ